MLQGFVHPAGSELLYCAACEGVHSHQICAERDALEGEWRVDEPVSLCCSKCGKCSLGVAGDLRALRPANPDELYCKVAGRSRIVMGDWVYVPGQPRPGVAVKRFRVQDEEYFVLRNADSTEASFRIRGTPDTECLENLCGYRLLPLQAAQTLLGDPVYHVQRGAFGRAVGMTLGESPQLLVAFESGVLLSLGLPARRVTPDPVDLAACITNYLADHEDVAKGVDVRTSPQGLALLSGWCRSIQERRLLAAGVRALPGVRCLVDRVDVKPLMRMADAELEQVALERIRASSWTVFGAAAQANSACLCVEGFVRGARAREELDQILSSLDGLRDFRNRLRIRPDADPTDRATGLHVASSLRGTAALRRARIRVACIEGTIYLEGEVQSSLQKQTAGFAAMWAVRGFRIANNLRVIRKLDATTSIQLV